MFKDVILIKTEEVLISNQFVMSSSVFYYV